MESVEVSAKTVEEAIEVALSKLALRRSEVEIEVIKEGKSGIFGLGGEEAVVRVTPLPKWEPAEVAAIAKEVVEKLLFLMKVPATVELRGEESGVLPSVTLDISGDELGLLIGRRGQTLTTLQYMVSLIVSRRLKSGVRVTIDIAGYRERRQQELRDLALRVAELVTSTKRTMTLEPMSPAERRIIHLALRDNPEVITQSEGEGENRKVVISPRRK
jgi:spoIIIJ-associated protein